MCSSWPCPPLDRVPIHTPSWALSTTTVGWPGSGIRWGAPLVGSMSTTVLFFSITHTPPRPAAIPSELVGRVAETFVAVVSVVPMRYSAGVTVAAALPPPPPPITPVRNGTVTNARTL